MMDCCVDRKPIIGEDGQALDPDTAKEADDKNTCKCCLHPITDKYMLKVSGYLFHEGCLRCTVCAIPLFEKCHEKDGNYYCRLHYYRECGIYRCAGCKHGISPTEMVFKLKDEMIFHHSCHRCFRCGKKLVPGERIYIDEVSKTISCLEHGSTCTDFFGTPLPSTSDLAQTIENNGVLLSSAQRELESPTAFFSYQFGDYGYDYGDEAKFLKRRGPRTTIKQYQLDVLNQMFISTPKPSKHARAKLALETGLSMRVIQVWFQNRRSKERRLKHLCNYLRRYEQRGLIPPPLGIGSNATDCNSSTEAISIDQLLAFPYETVPENDDDGSDFVG